MPQNDSARIAAVEARDGLRLIVTWARGPRAGQTETVDLSPLIHSTKFFRPLRDNRELFVSAHPILDGDAIGFGEEDNIDISAESVASLAEEAMSSEDFREFMKANHLSETAVAAMLGYGRRQVVNFASGEAPIPRVFALACRYLSQKKSAGFLQSPNVVRDQMVNTFAIREAQGEAHGSGTVKGSWRSVPEVAASHIPYLNDKYSNVAIRSLSGAFTSRVSIDDSSEVYSPSERKRA